MKTFFNDNRIYIGLVSWWDKAYQVNDPELICEDDQSHWGWKRPNSFVGLQWGILDNKQFAWSSNITWMIEGAFTVKFNF